MIAKKTLQASVKAFRDFAKKMSARPEKLQELDARDTEMPLGHRPAYVQPG